MDIQQQYRYAGSAELTIRKQMTTQVTRDIPVQANGLKHTKKSKMDMK